MNRWCGRIKFQIPGDKNTRGTKLHEAGRIIGSLRQHHVNAGQQTGDKGGHFLPAREGARGQTRVDQN